MTAPFCTPQLQTYWLGVPGGKWLSLNLPDSDYSATLDQGRITHALLSGGNAVQRQAKSRRTVTLAWTGQTPDLADQIISAAYGLLGPGPYAFVDPTWRNVQPGHIAACGALAQNSDGFIPSGAGTVAFSTAVAPPTLAPLSGVQAWVVGAVNNTLGVGQSAAAVNQSSAPPPLPSTPMTWGFWLKSLAATTITVTAQCCNAAGVSTGTVVLGTWAVTTSWTRFAIALASASVPALTASVTVTLKSSANTTVDLAAIDTQYISAASNLPSWVLGLGVPRMLISGTQPINHGGRLFRRNHGLTLVEAA